MYNKVYNNYKNHPIIEPEIAWLSILRGAVQENKIILTPKVHEYLALKCAEDAAEFIEWIIKEYGVDRLADKLRYENFGGWRSRTDLELLNHLPTNWHQLDNDLHELLIKEYPSLELDRLINDYYELEKEAGQEL